MRRSTGSETGEPRLGRPGHPVRSEEFPDRSPGAPASASIGTSEQKRRPLSLSSAALCVAPPLPGGRLNSRVGRLLLRASRARDSMSSRSARSRPCGARRALRRGSPRKPVHSGRVCACRQGRTVRCAASKPGGPAGRGPSTFLIFSFGCRTACLFDQCRRPRGRRGGRHGCDRT